MAVNFENHPCFNAKARHSFGRIHLPVAPKCNIQCKFCDRKFDCANETRPGVTSSVLTPVEALAYLNSMMQMKPNISVVGIAGPGDPFANPYETMTTLRLVRANYPEMLLCVATNGLGVLPYVKELAELEVSHITVTINAIKPEIGAGAYAWARDDKKIYRGESAAKILIERQLEAVKELKKHNIVVKVNTILIPGVNDEHVEEIAKAVSDLGADLLNVMPLYPVADTDLGDVEPPSAELVASIRATAGEYLPQMKHCTRCRADAAGLLGDDSTKEVALCMQEARKMAASDKPYVAVASVEGQIVNLHLGEAEKLWIFGKDGESFKLVERRDTPARGNGDERWLELSRLLSDCRVLLASGIGQKPRKVLEQMGIKVVEMEGLIEDALIAVYEGREIRSPKRETVCGQSCSGGGMGCA